MALVPAGVSAARALRAGAADAPRTAAPPAGRLPATAPGRGLDQQGLREAYGQLPMSFEANRGQTDPRVKFLSRGDGYTLFLTSDEAVLSLGRGGDAPRGSVLRMKLRGARPAAEVAGLEELPGKHNYLGGRDPRRWRKDVPTFGRVRYAGVYPGVDLVYYGNQRQLEYDFHVAPGADPARIALGFAGADRLEIEPGGDLLLHTPGGVVRQLKPFLYQEGPGGGRREVAGRYVRRGAREIGFAVGAYDRTRPLVIDPVLVYSTYLGSTGSGDEGRDIAVDSQGHAYVVGVTNFPDFPVTEGAFQTSFSGFNDERFITEAFVTKLSPEGNALVYSTYLGGAANDSADSVALDAEGHAYVVGVTASADFPTTPGAFQTAHGGGNDVFVTKLDPAGAALAYSTLVGGSGNESGHVAVGPEGSAYVGGSTTSPNFPTTPGAYDTTCGTDGACGGGGDAFVFKLDPAGAALAYSTFVGGSRQDGAAGIALDAAGNAYIAGTTAVGTDANMAVPPNDFPTTPGAFQRNYASAAVPASDAFVTKLNADGTALVYSTYLGGKWEDLAHAIAVDAAGSAYVTGMTDTLDFPVRNAVQPALGNHEQIDDAFVTKLTPDGSDLVFSTYFGADASDAAYGLALDGAGQVYITGTTNSSYFPTRNAFQGRPGSAFAFDAFVARFNPDGTLDYSTYFGGLANENGRAVAVGPAGDAFFTGRTAKERVTRVEEIPLVNPYQGVRRGNSDAYIARLRVGEDEPTYAVSGRVTTPDGQGLAGAQITVHGDAQMRLHTNADGFYRVDGLRAGGNYLVDGFKMYYITTPDDYTFNSLGANQTADFVSTPQQFHLGGRVTHADGTTGIPGVTVELGGARSATAQTDANGDYSFRVIGGQNYTVTATSPQYTYNPPTRTYAFISQDQYFASFYATPSGATPTPTPTPAAIYSISGQVTVSGAPVSGVTVTLQGTRNATAATGADGRYSFTGLQAGGSYTVSPPQSVYNYAPQQHSFTMLGGNQTADFEGTSPAPPPVNHALASRGATASASSTMDAGRAALAAINGDRSGRGWGSNPATGSGWHDSTNNTYPDWLEVTFNGAKTIHTVNVFSVQDNVFAPQEPTEALTFTKYGVVNFGVEYWDAQASAWAPVPGQAAWGNNKVWCRVTFAPVSTTKIRVVVNHAQAGYSRIAEVEAWGDPGADSPPPPPARVNHALAAQGATAAASSTLDAGRSAQAAINGDRRGAGWGTNPSAGSGWHDATNNAYPDWLEVTLNGTQTIDEVNVFSVQDNVTSPSEPTESLTFTKYGVTGFAVEHWTGSAWEVVPGGLVVSNNKVWAKLTFAPVTTTKIRVVVNSALAGYSRLAEVEAWGPAGAAPPPAPRVNVAAAANGATAAASSTLDSTRTAQAVINGDRAGRGWGSNPSTGSGWHDSTNNTYPDWLEVTFSGAQTISEVNLFSVQDNVSAPQEPTEALGFTKYGVRDFDVEYWDGSAWQVVPGGMVNGNDKVWRKVTFAPLTTTKIRVVVRGALAGYSRITEVEAY